jgi:hypothetical protein
MGDMLPMLSIRSLNPTLSHLVRSDPHNTVPYEYRLTEVSSVAALESASLSDRYHPFLPFHFWTSLNRAFLSFRPTHTSLINVSTCLLILFCSSASSLHCHRSYCSRIITGSDPRSVAFHSTGEQRARERSRVSRVRQHSCALESHERQKEGVTELTCLPACLPVYLPLCMCLPHIFSNVHACRHFHYMTVNASMAIIR